VGNFPDGFVFGVATAAYQVEGGIENDWSEWERAGKLKDPAARCGRAVDHWNRFEEDLRLALAVGATAFRISLEWARLEPAPGRFDEAAVEAYRRRLLRMRELGLSPVVTLHHFTHPSWFAKQTPWHEDASVDAFRRYARVCARILAGLPVQVIPFNEPMVLLLGGYLQGVIPPGIADGKKAMAALVNLVRAHVASREEVRAQSPGASFGTSQNVLAFAPDRSWHPLDRAVVRLAGESYNHAFLRAVTTGEVRIFMPGLATVRAHVEGARDAVDFIGLNYYSRAHLRFVPRPPFLEFHFRDPLQRGLTDIGWEQYPEGFAQLIREAHREYRLPIWITENGIDDREGARRPAFLHQHWSALLDAVAGGADVRGYLYWSLIDNFEWLEGWGPRFGLYRVDFDTLERTPTAACDYFRRVATSGTLVPPRGG
jgi:beta-glucosidase